LKTLIFAAEDDENHPALLCYHLAAVLSDNERRKTKFQIFVKLKIKKNAEEICGVFLQFLPRVVSGFRIFKFSRLIISSFR
jgi:hypothetical protein